MECNCSRKYQESCIDIVPIFSSLTPEEKTEVIGITSHRDYEKGELIYVSGAKGEKLYVIHTGKVKITRLSNSGKEQVIRVLQAGEFMGELSLFSPILLTDNAEVLERTTVCIISAEELKELMKKYPSIAFKVIEELSMRLERAETLIQNISLHRVERRLADTLLEMANTEGEVVLNISKKDLASHIGMSQETLSRKLSSFQDSGWIKLLGHRRITLLDREALRDIE